MSVAYRAGDFVWCAFPQRETPARPGPLHVVYVLLTTQDRDGRMNALVAYTTSQPWLHDAKPPGVFIFDRSAAAAFGQSRAFVLDARRLAYVPIEQDWFPRKGSATGGVEGHATATMQRQIQDAATRLLRAQPPLTEKLGPLWP